MGDKIKIGQQIARASDGTLGLYSSVSGKVSVIEDRKGFDLNIYKSIVIENDGEFEEGEFDEVVELEQLSYSQILNLIGAYGIREYRKGGIPLYEKLKLADKNNVQWVIVNGVECEPYFTAIYRRFMDDSEILVNGIKVLKHLFVKADVIVAIGDDKMDAVIEMERRTKNEPKVKVTAVPDIYPGGEAASLIYQLTGRRFEDELQAASEGIVCIQADTLCALSAAVFEGVPPMSRVLTVSGEGCAKPGNYEVLFGTSIAEVIEMAGGKKNEISRIVAGGPFSGVMADDLSVSVTQGLQGILLLSEKEAPEYEAEECIKCGYCVSVCPNRLVPQKLLQFAKNNQMDKFLKWYGNHCTMCGCCTYICPSHIPLTGYFGEMKNKLKDKGVK